MFLAGHSVAMVTYCATKIIPTCSPVIGQYFDTMIVASVEKDPSKSTSWNVLETVLSHLKLMGTILTSRSLLISTEFREKTD